MKGKDLIRWIKEKEAEDMEIRIGVQGYEIAEDDYICVGTFGEYFWITDECHYPHEEEW